MKLKYFFIYFQLVFFFANLAVAIWGDPVPITYVAIGACGMGALWDFAYTRLDR